jgi:adenosylhomocysteine nucleosidase
MSSLSKRSQQSIGGREYSLGTWHESVVRVIQCISVLSGIGKVAAAATTASLILHFKCDAILFTGVAGGLGEGVQVGDMVVGAQFVQHDMDASPLFPRYELPLYGKRVLDADAAMTHKLMTCCERVLPQLSSHHEVQALVQRQPQLHHGLIASGDRFVSSCDETRQLIARLHDAQLRPLCVEMEGAAVAQVCHDFDVPFAVLRTVSDRADEEAHVDFIRFIEVVASHYSDAVVHAFCESLSTVEE